MSSLLASSPATSRPNTPSGCRFHVPSFARTLGSDNECSISTSPVKLSTSTDTHDSQTGLAIFVSILIAIGMWFYGCSTSWMCASFSLSVLSAPFSAFYTRCRDPYGMFHRALNAPPAGTDGSSETEWLNMGLWETTGNFPEACEGIVSIGQRGENNGFQHWHAEYFGRPNAWLAVLF